MKAIALYAAIAVMGSLAGAQSQTVVQNKMGGWSSSSAYNQLYNPKTEVTISGKIVGITEAAPAKSMTAAESLLIKTAKNHTVTVDLGPAWFVDNQRPKLQVNDVVKVTGSKAKLDNRSFIIARKLIRGNHALYVRELTGFPMWVAIRDHPDEIGPGAVALNLGPIGNNEADSPYGPVALATPPPPPPVETPAPTNPTNTADLKPPIQGTVQQVFTSQDPQTGQIEQYVEVNTPTGPVNVDLGPQWYMQQQPVTFNTGGNISITGIQAPGTTLLQNNGNPIYLANGLNYGNQFLVLRNGQITAFNAWY